MHSKSYNRLRRIDVNYMLACEMYTFLLLCRLVASTGAPCSTIYVSNVNVFDIEFVSIVPGFVWHIEKKKMK